MRRLIWLSKVIGVSICNCRSLECVIHRLGGRILNLAHLIAALQFVVKLLRVSLLLCFRMESLDKLLIFLLEIAVVQ